MPQILDTRTGKYTGKNLPALKTQDETTGAYIEPYIPDEALVEVVDLAIRLGRPLLLKGEPGCGKTRLARAVAYELGLPYQTWHIKSTSRARDGLYVYNTLAQLRDAQLAASGRLSEGDIVRIRDPWQAYVQFGPLGHALQSEHRTIVLIDEIDKADIDFPNDLLLELDEHWFEVEELRRKVPRVSVPIVFITSNEEKDLPDAFLRRCLFHYIEFPTPERLVKIMEAHFPTTEQALLEAIIEQFLSLRQQMSKEHSLTKKVSTSELIDWFNLLRHYFKEDEILAQLAHELKYPGVLLKNWDDYRQHAEAWKRRGQQSGA